MLNQQMKRRPLSFLTKFCAASNTFRAGSAHLLLLHDMGRYKVDIQVLIALGGQEAGATRHHGDVDGH